MRLSQKAKYIGIGALGMMVAIPIVLKATDAVPLTFSQGDILSAEVLNALFGRLNDAQKGFTTATLDGNWTCESFSPPSPPPGPQCVADGLMFKKSGALSVNADAGTWTYDNGSFLVCDGGFSTSGRYEVRKNFLVIDVEGNVELYPMLYRVPSEFAFGRQGVLTGLVSCVKQNQPPTPPTGLTATAEETTVVTCPIFWST
jgi:hypothetical protein